MSYGMVQPPAYGNQQQAGYGMANPPAYSQAPPEYKTQGDASNIPGERSQPVQAAPNTAAPY